MEKKPEHVLSRGQIVLMAACTGLIVANIYYCQPLILPISKEFGVAKEKAGNITVLTQIGYALGLLFLVPLGDMLERKKQILFTTLTAVLSLILAAKSTSLLMLEIASFLIGFTSVIPQLILPLAAHLAAPEKRGKVVGSIMSGLLVGILLSRTLSGWVGVWMGWRSMFWIAAGITASLLLLMRVLLPHSKPHYTGSYSSLMQSLLTLVKEQPLLREASAINALAFGAFSMFWTAMVLHLSSEPFNYNSDTIGMFGLAAAAGALIAPLIGGSADKRNPRVPIGYGIMVIACSYLLFLIFPHTLAVLIVGIVILDLGIQAIHVSNQSRIYALLPQARNRLNTVFMTVSFIGTSLGSAVGLIVWSAAGWTGVCLAGIVLMVLAFIIYAITYKKALDPIL
ncbi:Predicted arabinose efflux permease, MFS family [Filimonas lacunae]|uniref:Predicted arabinose efflux permease, MFS family n=1 Tax=Filimonas lacunae TaxID=477680 RepID=A0A173MAS6_9BACT|nr:MFS transporter [Filimonas lacunae]BAV04620.1 MFS permease [Filimonas lacunae]SIT32625.1 Predicted arabinose efflux permease, MFS family [Filimonas lacunae]